MTRRLLVVANAAAGSTDDDSLDEAMTALGDADVHLERTASPEDLDRVLRERDGRQLVVVGGDGSVHAVVAALHRSGTLSADDPVALVPLGTGNDLARALGIPLDAREAAAMTSSGTPRRLDLLVDDAGGVVVNVVHVGIGATAAEHASRLKESVGPLAYPLGAVAAGASTTGWRLRVTVDGNEVADEDEPVLMVALGLGSSIGGGTEVAPDATPDDGLVDVVVSTATGPFARIGYARQVRDGEHVERDDVVTVRGREVTVEGEEFGTNADGELDGPFSRRTWSVVPGAWSVVAP